MKIESDTMKTDLVTTIFNSPQPIYQNGGQFQMAVPQSHVMIPKPFSYEFRVAEWCQGDDVVKVGLQVKVYEHNSTGFPMVRQDWTDVERVRIELP